MRHGGPKKDSGRLGLDIQEWNVAQKHLKNNAGFFNLFYP